jgi:hypothetical protein
LTAGSLERKARAGRAEGLTFYMAEDDAFATFVRGTARRERGAVRIREAPQCDQRGFDIPQTVSPSLPRVAARLVPTNRDEAVLTLPGQISLLGV